MPANLGPQYLAAEEHHRQAMTDEEKLAALEEMMATIPKHKGTEKMQADIKRRMSKAREGIRAGGKGAKRKELFKIDKEGAGQVVLVGPPNSGKSQIMRAMTRAEPEVADYPFTTRTPLPGMAQWNNIQFQLIDMPPVAEETSQSWFWALMRLSDALLIVLDAGDDDVLTQADELLKFMKANNVFVKNEGEMSLSDKRALFTATKCDLPGAPARIDLLRESLGDGVDIIPVSGATGEGLDVLAARIFFDLLGKIRVYTHPPGRKPDFTSPFVLDKETTVLGAAREIHKEIAETLKHARIWGKGVFDGQMVPRDHVLHDGDIVVFYT